MRLFIERGEDEVTVEIAALEEQQTALREDDPILDDVRGDPLEPDSDSDASTVGGDTTAAAATTSD